MNQRWLYNDLSNLPHTCTDVKPCAVMQTKIIFPHSILGWGKKVCHHSTLHNIMNQSHTHTHTHQARSQDFLKVDYVDV